MHAQQLEFLSLLPAAEYPRPIVLLLGLALRVRDRFPQNALSSHWLITWARATIGGLIGASRAALAIDDPLERLHDDLVRALKNDPPATRRAILRAVAQVHKNTEDLAAHLDPHCPAHLLTDKP